MESNVRCVVINVCFGGFNLSDAGTRRYAELAGLRFMDGNRFVKADGTPFYARYIARDDPHLVQTVREMGTAANGKYSQLKVVEIPVNVDFEVEEYDGSEKVVEKHRVWG